MPQSSGISQLRNPKGSRLLQASLKWAGPAVGNWVTRHPPRMPRSARSHSWPASVVRACRPRCLMGRRKWWPVLWYRDIRVWLCPVASEPHSGMSGNRWQMCCIIFSNLHISKGLITPPVAQLVENLLPSTFQALSIITRSLDGAASVPFQMRGTGAPTTLCLAQGHTPLGSAGTGHFPLELLQATICGSVSRDDWTLGPSARSRWGRREGKDRNKKTRDREGSN